MKVPEPLVTIVLVVAAITIIGCGVSYGDVSEPSLNRYSPMMFGDASPDKAYTPHTFVQFFNAEKAHNEFRVSDWPGIEVFRFRLPNVEVGDGTVIYKSSKGFPPDKMRSLKVTCTFADAAVSRTINNGDTVDIEGRVADARRGGLRIAVDLKPCYRIEYER